MPFTTEQINQIKEALVAGTNFVKDTQFPMATTPLDGTENMPIIQENLNKNINVQTFIKEVANEVLGYTVDFLNISMLNANEQGHPTYYDLSAAIAAVPVENRKQGLFLLFLDDQVDAWALYYFSSNSASLVESEFLNTSFWIPIMEHGYLASDFITNNTIKNNHLDNKIVTTNKLADDAVTTINVTDGAIINSKLGVGSVQGDNIANNTIQETNISDGAISGNKIKQQTITNTNLGDKIIESRNMNDNSIITSNITNGVVTGAKIANATITNSNIAPSTIQGSNIANSTINSGNLNTNSIITDKVADGAITQPKIASNVKVANPQNLTVQVAGNTYNYDGSVATTVIVPDATVPDRSITGDKIAQETITNINLGDEIIEARNMNDNSVRVNNIVDGAVTQSKIATDVTTPTPGKLDIYATQYTQSYQLSEFEGAQNYDVDIDLPADRDLGVRAYFLPYNNVDAIPINMEDFTNIKTPNPASVYPPIDASAVGEQKQGRELTVFIQQAGTQSGGQTVYPPISFDIEDGGGTNFQPIFNTPPDVTASQTETVTRYTWNNTGPCMKFKFKYIAVYRNLTGTSFDLTGSYMLCDKSGYQYPTEP